MAYGPLPPDLLMNDMFVCRKFIPLTRHDKCYCPATNLRAFFEYDDSNNWSELVTMVVNGDTTQLDQFIDENIRVRIVDRHGNNPLHLAIIFNKMDVFDYILQEKRIRNLDACNRYGQACLHLAVIAEVDHVVEKLIEAGADVNVKDEACCTPLHIASTRKTPRMCHLLLDLGANMNAQNLLGKTVIYHACQHGTMETICMLLYYGADAEIPDSFGVLPLAVATYEFPDQNELHEILFNHTFESNKKYNVNLANLTSLMRIKSPLFFQVVDLIENVNFSKTDLSELANHAMFIEAGYFKTFLKRHKNVTLEMLKNPDDLYVKISTSTDVNATLVKFIEFLTVMFKFRRWFNFLENVEYYGNFLMVLIDLYKQRKLTLEVLTQTVCFLYSHGLTCELHHLITIYETCGFCELFKILLHLDIYVTYEEPKSFMPYLICDVHMRLDILLNYVTRPCKGHRSALKFFSSQKLRNFLWHDQEMREEIKKLPQVPSLVELSRDVARRHIIKRFRIKKPRNFYSLLKKMPISEVYKKILTYEKELYPINIK